MTEDPIAKILRENKAMRRRAIITFISFAALTMLLGVFLLMWTSKNEERECRAKGGELQCSTASGVVDGKPAVLETCSCVVVKDDR